MHENRQCVAKCWIGQSLEACSTEIPSTLLDIFVFLCIIYFDHSIPRLDMNVLYYFSLSPCSLYSLVNPRIHYRIFLPLVLFKDHILYKHGYAL